MWMELYYHLWSVILPNNFFLNLIYFWMMNFDSPYNYY